MQFKLLNPSDKPSFYLCILTLKVVSRYSGQKLDISVLCQKMFQNSTLCMEIVPISMGLVIIIGPSMKLAD